ncbi:MAG: hypothetical protein R3E39_09575 [Anaerolineae bacterium]
MSTNDPAIERETKQILRQIQNHLCETHVAYGAVKEMAGMMDVYHHPTSKISTLNYITPRRNTAYVSRIYIEQGLEVLTQLERTQRVVYVDGLYPPQFAKSLRELGLQMERETPIMVYKPGGIQGLWQPPPLVERALPDGISIKQVSDQEGIGQWWYVWRNGHYDVLTLGVEPLFVGKDMEANWLGRQMDYVLYRSGFPAGVVRVSMIQETAHILAMALLKEIRSPAMIQILQMAAVKGALDKGARLIFAPGEQEAERRMARELGFMDFGNIICYSAAEEAARGNDAHSMELSVFAFS